jgi:hypothetical protein
MNTFHKLISPVNEQANAATRNIAGYHTGWTRPRRRHAKPPLICGLDLRTERDHSALCFLESEYRLNVETAVREQHFLCRYLRRLRLGLGYPEIAEYISRLDQQLSERYGREAIYVVDSTSVDSAVLNYFREKIGEDQIKEVAITAGREDDYEPKPDEFYVPKQQSTAQLQILLQTGRLHLPDTIYSKVLKEELLHDGPETQGSSTPQLPAQTGTHDDLVTSCSLAVLWLTRQRRFSALVWF